MKVLKRSVCVLFLEYLVQFDDLGWIVDPVFNVEPYHIELCWYVQEQAGHLLNDPLLGFPVYSYALFGVCCK